MIIVNPEFHRYVWLNFSSFRLISMPIILMLILYVFSHDQIDVWHASIFPPAFYTFIIVVYLWGNYEAASASNKDIGQNTWDFQKMSSLSPFEVLIGKLFGSTSYVWYTGLMLLGIIIFSYDSFIEYGKIKRIPLIRDFPAVTQPTAYLLFSGLMGHATAFFFGTGSFRKKKTEIVVPFVIGIIVSFTVFILTTSFALKIGVDGENAKMNWHSLSVHKHTFLICSLLYAFFWIVIASYRNIREELQFKNSPVVFMVFLVSFCIYVTGYLDTFSHYEINSLNTFAPKLFVAFLIIMACTYVTVFMDASNLAKYRRWVYAFKAKEWKRFFESTPLWIGCFILLVPAFLLSNALDFYLGNTNKILNDNFSIPGFTCALILFTMRDGFIFHSILLGKIERHKFFLLVIYIFIFYILLPYFVSNVIKGSSPETVLNALQIFYPIPGPSFFYSCAPILIQAFIAFFILRYVVKSLRT